jgi:hypothetical protein
MESTSKVEPFLYASCGRARLTTNGASNGTRYNGTRKCVGKAVDRGGRSKLSSVVLGRTGGPWPEEIAERASRSMSTTICPKVRDVM